MLRVRRFLLLTLLAAGASILRAESLSIETAQGTRVGLEATSLAPGGIIVARLVAAPGIKRVSLSLGNQTIRLGPLDSGLEPFGFIGLDLGINPGPRDVVLTALYADGKTERTVQSIEIVPREFRVKKLSVLSKYVTPPRSVEERIKLESELLTTVYGTDTPRWMGEGPFALPHEGEMAPNFGERRVYNSVPRSSHAGVDIAAPAGAPVRAANSGRVILSRDLYFSGKTVIIDHGLGLLTVYCHFSELMVKRGDQVKKGRVIGLAGSTGLSTGPHLHWSARVHQSRIDPSALVGRLSF